MSGFFDKIKESGEKLNNAVAKAQQEHNDKVAQLKEARGNKLKTLGLNYAGGYNDYRKAAGLLHFYEKQVEFASPMSTHFTILNTDIRDVAIEGKDEVGRRVTVTRLLAVGIFAFALKKKTKEKEAYLTLELTDGQEVVFFVEKISPMELKTQLAQVISRVKQGAKAEQTQAVTGGSVADELTKLADLRDRGILTQDEFDAKKGQLLGL